MPLNSQGTIQVFSDAHALATYAYAPQDTGVFLRSIPSGGTEVLLPEDPNDGDWYEFEDADGSCGASTPIILTAGDGSTVQGGASITFHSPYSAGVVRYSSEASNWILASQSASGNTLQETLFGASTGGQIVTTAYVVVAGCSLNVDITSTAQKVVFSAALGAIGSGSQAAGLLSWRVILDPAGADTTIGFANVSFAADQVSINAGACFGEISALTPGMHVIRIEAICSLTPGVSIGVLGSAQSNATLLAQVYG